MKELFKTYQIEKSKALEALREVRGNQPLGGGRLFALTDEGDAGLAQGSFKGEAACGQGEGLPFQLCLRQSLPGGGRTLAGVVGQLVQNRHASTSGRLLTSMNFSSVASALPLSMSSAACRMPACISGALPPM